MTFKVLVVEDEVLDGLVDAIRQKLPPSECRIDGAKYLDMATELVDIAKSSGEHYDAAVLDFRLPTSTYGPTQMDWSLCDRIRDQNTLVIHVSNHLDDDGLRGHLAYHAKPDTPPSYIVDKLTKDGWGDHVASLLRTYLYSRLVEKQIDNLTGSSPDPYALPASSKWKFRPLTSTAGSNFDRIAVSETIIQHWWDIDDAAKKKVGRVFRVDATKRPIQIQLV